MENNNDNSQPNQPAGDQTEGNTRRTPRKRATPQQVPPLPRSRFTRFLVAVSYTHLTLPTSP
jgi:hypothetical protein